MSVEDDMDHIRGLQAAAGLPNSQTHRTILRGMQAEAGQTNTQQTHPHTINAHKHLWLLDVIYVHRDPNYAESPLCDSLAEMICLRCDGGDW